MPTITCTYQSLTNFSVYQCQSKLSVVFHNQTQCNLLILKDFNLMHIL